MNVTKSGALWGDVFTAGNGLIGCSYDQDNNVIVDFYTLNTKDELVKMDSTVFNFDERILFNRSCRNRLGHIIVMGQEHKSGKFAIKSVGGNYPNPFNPGGKFPGRKTYGTSSCDVIASQDRFDYVVQIAEREFYDSFTQLIHQIPQVIWGTSQGIIQLTETEVRWADLWRQAIPQMLFPFQVHDIYIGEGATDPPHIQALDANEQKNIYNGDAQRPRMAYDAAFNIVAVTSRSNFGVTFNFFRRPLRNLNVVPIPDPIPEPEPIVIPNKLEEVRKIAQAYPSEFKDAHRFELGDRAYVFIRRVASYLHYGNGNLSINSDPRFGNNGKRGTDDMSADALSFKDGNELKVIDCINSAGSNDVDKPASPSWGEVGGVSKWIQPIKMNGNEPVPIPIPIPIPVPPPTNVDCTPVVPTQDIIRDSLDNLRQFCQNYSFNGNKPYTNDEINSPDSKFISDGLIYFMMSDTGNWARILMNPSDKRPWNEKRMTADNALMTYMKRRVGDNS